MKLFVIIKILKRLKIGPRRMCKPILVVPRNKKIQIEFSEEKKQEIIYIHLLDNVRYAIILKWRTKLILDHHIKVQKSIGIIIYQNQVLIFKKKQRK